MQQDNFDGFDLARDVIGDDLVVGNVVYSSKEWESDGEGGVQRRGTNNDDEFDRLAEQEEQMTTELISRAEKIGAGFAEAAGNISTGPRIVSLLRAQSQLLSDAEDEGFDLGRIEEAINAAFDR